MRKLLSIALFLAACGSAFAQGAGVSLVTTPPTGAAIPLENTTSPLNIGIATSDFVTWLSGQISPAISGTLTVTSTNASALSVGANGSTNPVLKIDASTASVATGVSVKGAAAAGGVAVAAISSGTNESLKIDAKGSGTITLNGTGTGNVLTPRAVLSSGAAAGVGYTTGAGCAVTQGTGRTTGVTCTGMTGAITLISAAGSATPASFTVTDSSVAATDTIIVNQKSGTDLYEIFVTAVGAGSFKITSFTTGGTTTEQPVFNFAVLKGAAS